MSKAKDNKNQKEWIELCEYVKKEILGYDDNQKFPRTLALKLRGLERGQIVANNNAIQEANYPYEVILLTFKINKNKILNYLKRNSARIKDENHKINIVMKIIEPEINYVYMHWVEVKKERDIINDSIIERLNHKSAEYKKRDDNIDYSRFKNLW